MRPDRNYVVEGGRVLVEVLVPSTRIENLPTAAISGVVMSRPVLTTLGTNVCSFVPATSEHISDSLDSTDHNRQDDEDEDQETKHSNPFPLVNAPSIAQCL